MFSSPYPLIFTDTFLIGNRKESKMEQKEEIGNSKTTIKQKSENKGTPMSKYQSTTPIKPEEEDVVSKQPEGKSSYVENDPFSNLILFHDPMNFGCCLAILGPICEPFCALCAGSS